MQWKQTGKVFVSALFIGLDDFVCEGPLVPYFVPFPSRMCGKGRNVFGRVSA